MRDEMVCYRITKAREPKAKTQAAKERKLRKRLLNAMRLKKPFLNIQK